METQDFEMPSPKRHKTDSPTMQPPRLVSASDSSEAKVMPQQDLIEPQAHVADEVKAQSASKVHEPNMLELLMQHIDSEVTDKAGQQVLTVTTSGTDIDMADPPASSELDMTTPDHLPTGLQAPPSDSISRLHTAAEINDLPLTAETLLQEYVPAAVEGEEDLEVREWETDSSPLSSDTTDSSDDSSEDESDDDEDSYSLLNPFEQARILMAGETGVGFDGSDNSDDEGETQRTVKARNGARTLNEKPEDILPRPDVKVTSATSITPLGSVTSYVENCVLITAKVSGEYKVLETGSVLCLGPPSYLVVGAVAETLGRVQQPLYTVRFASESELRDAFGLKSPAPSATQAIETELSQPRSEHGDTPSLLAQLKDTPIFFVDSHSTFVFTQALKTFKGTDASNIHDEEVGDEEMEFSDDEAEAEYKRRQKLRKKGIDPDAPRKSQPQYARGRGRGRADGRPYPSAAAVTARFENRPSNSFVASSTFYVNNDPAMNYDDVEDGEASTDYAPLKRPDNFFQFGQPPSSEEPSRTIGPSREDLYRNQYSSPMQRGGYASNTARNQSTSRFRGNGFDRNTSTNTNGVPSQPYDGAQRRNSYQSDDPVQPQQYQSQYRGSGVGGCGNGRGYTNHNNARGRGRGRGRGDYQQGQGDHQQGRGGYQQGRGSYQNYSQLDQRGQHASNDRYPKNYNADGAFQSQSMYAQTPQVQSSTTPYQPAMPSSKFDFQTQAQNQWTQYHANQAQQAAAQPALNINAESLAQVQRQLEEMRKRTGQN